MALANLTTRVVMALQSLTVDDFMEEVLIAMNSESKRIRKSRIEIVFYGKSIKSPFHFRRNDLLEKVHTKICAIEESRELSLSSSNDDLSRMIASATVTDSVKGSSHGQSMDPVQVR